MKHSRWKYLVFSFVVLALLSGCSGKKAEFIAQFKEAYPNEKEDIAVCVYDIASDSLEDDQYDLFVAMFFRDQKKQKEITNSLGLLKSATSVAKVGVVTGRTVMNCGWEDKP
ncbi:MAG: hypothetical protein R3E73_15655 [Porticoccaceae bacterium]|nr:hypothetical protein [Pseudomonadales bacterium]MCP5171211.1 hypothetical protein [Pseudomonadales bacterium]MCP5301550.1 hypothetical protein [Pseudomonadales bacterium]